jgi:hypothetical protein
MVAGDAALVNPTGGACRIFAQYRPSDVGEGQGSRDAASCAQHPQLCMPNNGLRMLFAPARWAVWRNLNEPIGFAANYPVESAALCLSGSP